MYKYRAEYITAGLGEGVEREDRCSVSKRERGKASRDREMNNLFRRQEEKYTHKTKERGETEREGGREGGRGRR